MSQHEVRWTQAEYPNENGAAILELTHEEHDRLVDLLLGAVEADLITGDWEILPASPMTLDEFLSVFGDDFPEEA